MAHVKRRKVYHLVFPDLDQEPLEAKVRSVTLGEFMEVSRLAELAKLKGRRPSPEELVQANDAMEGLFTNFANALSWWNLEEYKHGDDCDPDECESCPTVPVPTTLEGIKSQDPTDVMEIVLEWIKAMSAVPDDLGKGSSDGVPSQELQIPMEALSTSQPNSHTPS